MVMSDCVGENQVSAVSLFMIVPSLSGGVSSVWYASEGLSVASENQSQRTRVSDPESANQSQQTQVREPESRSQGTNTILTLLESFLFQ